MCAEHAYCAELQTQNMADMSFMRWINTGWDNTIKILICTRWYKGIVRCAAALVDTALCMRANHVTKRTVNLVLTVGISDVAELNKLLLLLLLQLLLSSSSSPTFLNSQQFNWFSKEHGSLTEDFLLITGL